MRWGFDRGAGRAAWQQRCRARDKTAKVLIMTFQRTTSRWNSRLSSYNERVCQEKATIMVRRLMQAGLQAEVNYYCRLVYLLMFWLNRCLGMTNGCTWKWRVIYWKVNTEKGGKHWNGQVEAATGERIHLINLEETTKTLILLAGL